MQKVITINLNGHAYQLEESGYELLRDYLARAERDLAGNPDRAEIIADLEQAIADKCQRFLGPHKSVVTATEVAQIVAEMGPVDAAAGEASAGSTDAGAGSTPGAEAPPKRLYRIPDGAMIGGVCNGIAAYFAVDVGLVRIGFVLTAIFTQGVGIIAYVVMMFVMPEASTAEQRAAAGGAPFNARDVVDRAKEQYTKGTRRMRRHWRQQQRHWRRASGMPGATVIYAAPPMAPVLLPVFGLLQFALFFLLMAAMVSLVSTGEILGWDLPEDVPVWAGLLILLVGYQLIASPLRGLQYLSTQPRAGVQPDGSGFWNAVVSLIALAFLFWVASNNIPEIREFLTRLPPVAREFGEAMREVFER